LREKRRHAKELSERLLESKTKIETAVKRIEKNKESSTEALQIVGNKQSEAASLVDELSKKRNEYKEIYEEMKRVKTEIDYTTRLVDQARRRLVAEFELWYRNTYGSNMDRNIQISQLDLFSGNSPEVHKIILIIVLIMK
jgi:kinesin family protein 6/9